MGVIDGGAAVCDLGAPPTFQRRKQHEHIGCTVALVFVIGPLHAPWFHRDWRARLGNQLLRGLVQTNKRPLWIMRLGIKIQHSCHRGYESAARLRRNDPLLFAVRLKRVFLRTRPMVLSLARSTMPSSTTLSS